MLLQSQNYTDRIIKILLKVKEKVYQNKDFRQLISYNTQFLDCYEKNLLLSLQKTYSYPKEQILASIQQIISNIENTPKKIASNLQTIIPHSGIICVPNPTPLIIQTLQEIEGKHSIFLPESTSFEIRNQLVKKGHQVHVYNALDAIEKNVDVTLLACESFSSSSLKLTTNKLTTNTHNISNCDSNIIIVATAMHHNPSCTSKRMAEGRIVTELGVFSHKSLIEEILFLPQFL